MSIREEPLFKTVPVFQGRGTRLKQLFDQRHNKSLGSKSGGEAGERSRIRSSWKPQDQEHHMNSTGSC